MAKFRTIKNSFIAGEISPAAQGRTDLPQYPHACKELKNMIPLLAGGAYRRPGTFYETRLDASIDHAPRLIPFIRSNSETYALYLGKVIGGNGFVSGFRTTSAYALSSGISCSGTHPYAAATFDASRVTPYVDEWREVQYCQSVDTLYLVHPNRKPQRIYRTAVDTFQVAGFDYDSTGTRLSGTAFRDAWPYLRQNSTAITMAISNVAVGAGRTLTASASFFQSTHVGAVFKVDIAGTIGCCLVTGYTSATQVTVEVIVAFGGLGAVTTWWESAWSDYRGWPRAISFYQQRLCYAGNANTPDDIWLTETNDYNQLSVSTLTDPYSSPTGSQPFTIQLASNRLNLIQWLSSDKTLQVGTMGDEAIIETETTGGFGADNAKVTFQSHFGSAYLQPVRAGKELMFCLPTSQEIRSLVFDQVEESYVDEPVQLLFDHYPKPVGSNQESRLTGFEWDMSRKTLWCNDGKGNLFGLTRDRKLGISLWHTHELGGYDADELGTVGGTSLDNLPIYAPTGGVVSLTVVPNPQTGLNDVWMIVKRKVNGSTYWCFERMTGGEPRFDTAFGTFAVWAGQYMVDSAVYESSVAAMPVTTFSVTHLEGIAPVGFLQSIYGFVTARFSAVTGGVTAIQEPYPTNYLTSTYFMAIGLGYTSKIVPVRPEAGSQIGTAQGAIKRIHQVIVRFWKTLSAKVGSDESNLETVIFRESSTQMGYSPELFTGEKLVKVDADYDRDGYVTIMSDQPLPFAVTSIVAEGQTYD